MFTNLAASQIHPVYRYWGIWTTLEAFLRLLSPYLQISIHSKVQIRVPIFFKISFTSPPSEIKLKPRNRAAGKRCCFTLENGGARH